MTIDEIASTRKANEELAGTVLERPEIAGPEDGEQACDGGVYV